MRHRLITLLAVIVLGAAAPARAWCEAWCLAPQPDSPSHCPSHDPAGDTTSVSGNRADQCPVLESARPAAATRVDLNAAAIAFGSPPSKTSAIHSPTIVRPHSSVTVFERSAPLRI